MTIKSFLVRIGRGLTASYRKVWDWEYLELVGIILVFMFSIFSILFTITADQVSNWLDRTQKSIITMRSYGDRFVAKSDALDIASSLVEMKIFTDNPHLARQTYIYSRQATGFNGAIEDLNREAEKKISSVADYWSNINPVRVLEEHKAILDSREAKASILMWIQGALLSVVAVFQVIITFIAFALGIRLIHQKINLKTTRDANQAKSAM